MYQNFAQNHRKLACVMKDYHTHAHVHTRGQFPSENTKFAARSVSQSCCGGVPMWRADLTDLRLTVYLGALALLALSVFTAVQGSALCIHRHPACRRSRVLVRGVRYQRRKFHLGAKPKRHIHDAVFPFLCNSCAFSCE